MKRLAVGTVLFSISLSIPAPSSADLVFFVQGLGGSVNSIEKVSPSYSTVSSQIRGITENAVAIRPSANAASQQFTPGALAESRFTLRPSWPAVTAPVQRQGAAADHSGLPSFRDLGEWLLVLVGFALSGIAVRNRSGIRPDDRNPAFFRLPRDL